MKTAVWIAFYLSLCGMIIGSLLRSVKTREILLELWVRTVEHIEGKQAITAVRLARQFIFALYARGDLTISPKKIAILSLIGAMTWAAFTEQLFIRPETLSKFTTPSWIILLAGNIAMGALVLPLHFLIEYFLAKIMLRIANGSNENRPFSLLLKIAASVCGYYAIPAVALALIFFAWGFSDLATSLSGSIMFIGPASLPYVLLAALKFGRDPAMPFAILSFLVSYATALLFSILAVTIVNSKIMLHCASWALENMSVDTSDRLFNWSLLAFTLSTGIMQALSF